jgi:hypothetical protein
MATKPEYDFTKLPKWAQEYIVNIERERDVAIRTLNEFTDSQTPSPFWYDEMVCLGEPTPHGDRGPTEKRHYIQAHRMTVKVGTGEIDFFLREPNVLEISSGWNVLRLSPYASNCVRIEEPKR